MALKVVVVVVSGGACCFVCWPIGNEFLLVLAGEAITTQQRADDKSANESNEMNPIKTDDSRRERERERGRMERSSSSSKSVGQSNGEPEAS